MIVERASRIAANVVNRILLTKFNSALIGNAENATFYSRNIYKRRESLHGWYFDDGMLNVIDIILRMISNQLRKKVKTWHRKSLFI